MIVRSKIRAPIFRAPAFRLQSRLLLVVVLAYIAVIGADAINLFGYRQTVLANARMETASLSRALAEQADGSFQTLDAILIGLRERMENDGGDAVSTARLQRVLDSRVQAFDLIHRLAVYDAGGSIVAQSGGQGPIRQDNQAGMAAAPRPDGLTFHRTHPDRALRLGAPARDPIDGVWAIPVSRRIDHQDGSFGGIVMASVPTAYFRAALHQVQGGETQLALLARADGIAMARWPADPRGEAHDLSRGDLFARVIGPGDRVLFTYVSAIDHLTRLGSYRRLAGVPALVMVSRSRDEILAAWRATASAHAAGLCVVLALIGLLGRRLAHRIDEGQRAQATLRATNRRLEQSEAAAARAKAWLEMAAEIAQVGHWHLQLGHLQVEHLEPGYLQPAQLRLEQLEPAEAPSLTWSDQVYRIHGQSRAGFQPSLDNAIDAYHPQDRAMVLNAVLDAIRRGTPYEFTARLIRPDGSTRSVLSRGLPQTDAAGRTISVFGVFVDITEQQQHESALRHANAEAEAANRALEEANRALETMAMQDALTGLANRRQFDTALDQEFRRAVRAGTSLALVMIDVDHFKQFNDLYGHQAGDACLRAIAATIPPVLNRPGDTGARYGGEEIVVLLPGNTEAGAIAMAGRIADAIRALGIAHAGSPHGVVTISAGIEAYVPVHEHDDAAEMVERADRALYAAKRTGRDRVVSYRAISDAPPTRPPACQDNRALQA